MSTGPALQRRAAGAAAAVAGGVALWFVIAASFSSDRGIDFTDEGLYFLAADPPSKTSAWVTPFGWSTAPFFRIVGHSIADFRTLGVWLAMVVGGSVGWAIARWVTIDSTDRRWSLMCRAGLAVVGAMGAPFYASSLLRTPNYNWVNLVGLSIGATGAILAANHAELKFCVRGPRAHLAVALLALGTCFAVPSKPTSAPLLLLSAAALVAPRLGRRRSLELAGLVAAWGIAIIAVAVATGLWPVSFLSTLWRSTKFPPLHPNQTIHGALKDVLRTPKVAFQQLRLLRVSAKVLVVLGAAIAVLVNRRRRDHWIVRCLPFLLLVVVAVGTEVPWPVIGGPGAPERFAWTGTANAAVLLLAAAALHLLANWDLTDRADRRRALSIAAFAIALTITFAFGSAMGIYHQMGLASSLLWLAAAVVVAAAGRGITRPLALATVTLAAVVMVTANTVDSRHHPYRNIDVADQVTPISVGPHHSHLLLDADTATFVEQVQNGARDAGFCVGTPLLGMAWSWSSTVPYIIGAKVPDELLLTLFGYENAPAVLDFTMGFVHGPAWHDAWVLTTDPATIETEQAAELRGALDRLPGRVGRSFPADYTLAMDVDGTQLWRPTDVAPGCGRP